MVIAQVCLRLATIKDHSNMCSFVTKHNATDVTSFEGACNWHADCRNVHQSCCCKLNVHFSTISSLQRRRRCPVNGRLGWAAGGGINLPRFLVNGWAAAGGDFHAAGENKWKNTTFKTPKQVLLTLVWSGILSHYAGARERGARKRGDVGDSNQFKTLMSRTPRNNM